MLALECNLAPLPSFPRPTPSQLSPAWLTISFPCPCTQPLCEPSPCSTAPTDLFFFLRSSLDTFLLHDRVKSRFRFKHNFPRSSSSSTFFAHLHLLEVMTLRCPLQISSLAPPVVLYSLLFSLSAAILMFMWNTSECSPFTRFSRRRNEV